MSETANNVCIGEFPFHRWGGWDYDFLRQRYANECDIMGCDAECFVPDVVPVSTLLRRKGRSHPHRWTVWMGFEPMAVQDNYFSYRICGCGAREVCQGLRPAWPPTMVRGESDWGSSNE